MVFVPHINHLEQMFLFIWNPWVVAVAAAERVWLLIWVYTCVAL